MFERRPQRREGPVLFDRVLASGCRRLAILGLHPGAGARTVLAALSRAAEGKLSPVGVVSSPRVPLEPEAWSPAEFAELPAPAGSFVATAAAVARANDRSLDLVEKTAVPTPLGELALYRVREESRVRLCGPTDPQAMKTVAERLLELGAQVVFLEGGFDRRAFAAPGVADGVVLVVGAGYSASPARSAAAARYIVEIFRIPPCGEAARAAWQASAPSGAIALLDKRGERAGILPPGLEDPAAALEGFRGEGGEAVGTVLLPHGLDDEFLIPLVRSKFRAALVVRDATRIHVSPVYFKAWLKSCGSIQVVRPLRLIGMATNPTNASGPDADPADFRAAVARALPDLPVHDVALEAGQPEGRRAWRRWE